MWIRMWVLMSLFWENDFSQTSHLNGFAPVWVSWCVLRFSGRVKDLLHCPHLKGFSPKWIRMCLIKWLGVPNDFPHWAHLCNFSPAKEGKLIARDVDRLELSTQRMFQFKLSTLTDAYLKLQIYFWIYFSEHFPFCIAIISQTICPILSTSLEITRNMTMDWWLPTVLFL